MKPKVLITTLVWKRHKLFKVWKQQIERFKKYADIEVLVAVSEGYESYDLVKDYNWIDVPNRPIGYKAQLRLRYMKHIDFDYCLFLGSDDIVSDKTFKQYLKWMSEGYEQIAPMDIYYYEAEHNIMMYCMGYIDHRRGEPIAVGRMLSRKLLERMKWNAWDIGECRFLDGHFYRKLEATPHKKKYYRMEHTGLFIVDVKTDLNMTPLIKRKNNYVIPPDILFNSLPKEETDGLCALFSE